MPQGCVRVCDNAQIEAINRITLGSESRAKDTKAQRSHDMKSRTLAFAALAMSSLLGVGASFAEPTEATPPVQSNPQGLYPRANGQAYQRSAQRPDNASRNGRENQMRQARNREEQQRAYNERWRDEPGAGPEHQWHRGDRLPPQYRSRQYVVDDWRGHHLNAPPRGYYWVQSGADYVLIAIATGIIAELLLNQ